MNRFDICEAYYCLAMEWQSEESQKILQRLNKIRFYPALSIRVKGVPALDEDVKELYGRLVMKYHGDRVRYLRFNRKGRDGYDFSEFYKSAYFRKWAIESGMLDNAVTKWNRT